MVYGCGLGGIDCGPKPKNWIVWPPQPFGEPWEPRCGNEPRPPQPVLPEPIDPPQCGGPFGDVTYTLSLTQNAWTSPTATAPLRFCANESGVLISGLAATAPHLTIL
jgi:hypothetical protein